MNSIKWNHANAQLLSENIICSTASYKNSIIDKINIKPGIFYIEEGKDMNTLRSNSRFEYSRLDDINHYSYQTLLLLPSENIRVIKPEAILFSNEIQFNRYLLGNELSRVAKWQILLSVKIKYLFSKQLSIQLNEMTSQIKCKLQKKKRVYLSSDEYFFISFMKILCSWDTQVSLLVVRELNKIKDPPIRSLLFQCFDKLSLNISICISEPLFSSYHI